jgi:hypothetical protein
MLNMVQKSFLEAYRVDGEGVPEMAIPIFLEEGECPLFLSDYACVDGVARRKFIMDAPEGLWLGGGAVMIYLPQGAVVIPDRRNGGNLGPSAQGWARYREGHDLRQASIREFSEEIITYTLAGEGDDLYQSCTELVPSGVTPKGRVDYLNLPLDGVSEYGHIQFDNWTYNQKDRVVIYVGNWDLVDFPLAHRLRIIYDDDFPQGRRPGTNPRVIDYRTRKEVGRFEGLQGYLPNDMEFHSVVARSLFSDVM